MVGTWVELPLYAATRGRPEWTARAAAGGLGYWLMIGALFRVNAVAATWTLLLPFLVSSFCLMFGNWCVRLGVCVAGATACVCVCG